jgi:ABC-type nitrate/sulfonate/bicarbonate transport system substrate-binding protein
MTTVRAGGKLALVAAGLLILGYAFERYAGITPLFPGSGARRASKLSPLDFPVGVAAPAGDLAALPARPLRLSVPPRGAAAAPLLAGGGVGLHPDSPAARGYGLELEVAIHPDEDALLRVLERGGERGGADAAVLSVDRLAHVRFASPESRLKAVMLLSYSRGADSVVGRGEVSDLAHLSGRKVATVRGPARTLLAYALLRAGLGIENIDETLVATSAQAALLLREGKVDAAAGTHGELSTSGKAANHHLLFSSAEVPHLIAQVLAVRGEMLARYPHAARRLVRALGDAAELSAKDPAEAVRLLGSAAPQLSDPAEALRAEPPASPSEGLAFFGIRGDAPVTYDALFSSAAMLLVKLGEKADGTPAAETRELAFLPAVSGP